MKIGVISDTHGSAAAWEMCFSKYLNKCEMIIHAGDVLYHGPRNPLPEGYDPLRLSKELNNCKVPIIFVKGNCDAEIDGTLLEYPVLSPYAVLHLNGQYVLVTHGQNLNEEVKADLAERYRLNLFISGHTHQPVLQKHNNTVFLNPGSCALPKNSEGPTLALWSDGEISLVKLSDGSTIKTLVV